MPQSDISRKLACGGPIHSKGVAVTCANMQVSPTAAMMPMDRISTCCDLGVQPQRRSHSATTETVRIMRSSRNDDHLALCLAVHEEADGVAGAGQRNVRRNVRLQRSIGDQPC